MRPFLENREFRFTAHSLPRRQSFDRLHGSCRVVVGAFRSIIAYLLNSLEFWCQVSCVQYLLTFITRVGGWVFFKRSERTQFSCCHLSGSAILLSPVINNPRFPERLPVHFGNRPVHGRAGPEVSSISRSSSSLLVDALVRREIKARFLLSRNRPASRILASYSV